MSKSRKTIYAVLACLLALCLAAGLSACDGKSAETGTYGYGEEGMYYYSASEAEDYVLTLRGGTYILTLESGTGSSGTYGYDPDGNSLTLFDGDVETGSGYLTDGGMSLTWEGRTYMFLSYEYYTVSFMDGGTTLFTQSVLNGKAAQDPGDAGKDGYVFLGWYADSDFTERYEFNVSVTADTTVYARFVESSGTTEYKVTFDYTGETTGTINGVVYNLPEPEKEGYTFIGWWVSDTNNADELTYRYDGETLYEDTTLFAFWASGSSYIGASIKDGTLTWENAPASTVTIGLSDEAGETLGSWTPQSSSYALAYDFASLPAGKYTVTITSGGVSETLTYVSCGLYRASGFKVIYSGIFAYDAVENAERYYLTIECGNENHDHALIDNGTSLYYDFSSCEMGPEGITFTVVAFADGYYYSASSYNYFLGLDRADVRVEDGAAVWDAVEDALEYEVYVDGALVGVTSGTSWSLSEYGTGTYEIAVRPVTRGYWSELSEAATFTKTTLAAPRITGIENYEISWTPVEGATGYIVRIGDTETTVGAGVTSLYLTEENYVEGLDSYEISVKAMAPDSANDSPYGEAVVVTGDYVGTTVSYSDGVVTWQYSLRAAEYVVTVNDGDEISVIGGNSASVTLDKSGNNEIRIYFYDDGGVLYGEASVTVYAYAIVFDARGGAAYLGGEAVEVIYAAKGDTVTLPTAEYEGMLADFLGWYTLPDLTGDPDAASYGGDGTKYGDGGDTFVFGGNGTTVIYASWVNRRMQVALDAGAGYLTGADGAYVEIPINGVNYSLPVPDIDDRAFAFIGWYSGENGTGTRYTYEDGSACATFSDATVTTLYAYWAEVLSFSLTEYNGKERVTVSKGPDIDLASEVTVPETYAVDGVEMKVEHIGNNAFQSCSSLEVLNIPDTIIYFDITNNGYSSGNGALASCANLKEVNVYATGGEADPAKEIIYYSEDGVLFWMNTVTEEVELLYYPYGRTDETYAIPATVSNEYECAYDYTPVVRDVVTTASGVFQAHTELKYMTIPGTLYRLGPSAFYGCSNLESVAFEDGVTGIGESAFYNCTSLKDVRIPDTVTAISDSAFRGCTALEGIVIPDGVTSLGTYVFYGCSSLVSVDLSSSLTAIGDYDFYNCTSLTAVDIPLGAAEIGQYAFYGCSALYAVSIPYSVTYIGQYAFYNCAALERITIPDSVTEMGTYALGSCKALETVVLSESLTEIADRLFYADSALKYVNIPSGVTSIGSYAFYACSALEEISLPYGVETLGNYAFQNCSSLKEMVIPDSVTELGTYLFSGCSSLSYVRLSENITVINDRDFYQCSSLSYIEFPDSVTAINQYAFYQCYLLNGITLPASLETIGSNAFYGCFSLTTVTIPENVTSIGSSAFSQCFDLVEVYDLASLGLKPGDSGSGYVAYYAKNVYTPEEGESRIVEKDGFRFIDDEDGNWFVFEYAGEDDELVLPDGIGGECYEILRYAFYGNSSVRRISIPGSVTAIGDYAFYNCTAVTEIDYDVASLPDLSSGNNVFSYAGQDAGGITVRIGASVERIPNYLFSPSSTASYAANIKEVVFADGSVCAEIGNRAFYACAPLESINIPDTVTRIGEYAFYNCTSLKYVNIPYGVTEIEQYTFYGCSSLDGIEIPGSVLSIGNYAFDACTSLTRVVVPDSVETLGTYCFYGCSSLREVQLSARLTEVNNYDFANCTSLVGIVIPEGVTSIGNYAFDGCTSLKYVSLPSTLGSIGQYSFRGCVAMTSLIIPENVTSIGSSAFQNCYKLVEVYNTAPEIVIEIGATSNGYVGYYAKNVYTPDEGETHLINLEGYWFVYDENDDYFLVEYEGEGGDIALPATAAGNGYEIHSYAFYGDDTITSVEIPSGVRSIGNYAFYDCVNIDTIYFDAASVEALSSSNYAFAYVGQNTDGVTVYIGADVTEIPDYLFYPASGTSYTPNITAIIFEEGSACEEIGAYAFRGLSSLETVVLPEGLRSVGQYAFYGCSSLTSVTLPDSLETIGSNAFYQCTSLESVVFGQGLREIGENAFYGCTSLDDISLPGGLTRIGNQAFYGTAFYDDASNWQNGSLYMGTYLISVDTSASGRYTVKSGTTLIACRAFYDCSGLTTISVSEATISIGDSAFYGCSSLVNINIPSGVEYIGSYAFYGCSSLSGVTIPEKVTEICDYTFYNCESLAYVTLPDGVTSIGERAFYGCTALEEIDIPEAVTEIGTYVFYGCTSLRSVAVPEGVTELPNYMFRGCTSLESVTYSDDVTSMGSYLFYECESLTRLIIPAGVTSIGTYAFYGCVSLEEVYYNATSLGDFTSSSYLFGRIGRDAESLTVYIGANVERIPAYLFRGSASPYTTSVVFGQGSVCAEIGSYAFYQNSYLVDINIPSTVTAIGQYAFYQCEALTYAYIPDGVTEIGQYTFYQCYSLTGVVIPDGVTTIGSNAFYQCYSLISINIPASVTSIGGSAFRYCYKLVEVCNMSSIPVTAGVGESSNGYIGQYALNVYSPDSGESLLIEQNGYTFVSDGTDYYLVGYSGTDTALTLPAGVNGYGYRIYQYAFYNCTSLTSVTIPSSVFSIGEYAFCGCSSLVSVVLADGLTEIDGYAFRECTALKAAYIPDSVTEMGTYVFYGCTSLESASLPGSAASVPNYTFYGCSGLVDFTMPGGVTEIGQYAFYGCSSLETITIPEGVTSIGNYAFYNCTALTEIRFDAAEMGNLSSGNRVFYQAGQGADGITVHIGASVTRIPNYLFFPYSGSSYSPNITYVLFEDGSVCTEIGNYAFAYLGSLTEITLPSSMRTLSNYAFYYSSGLKTANLNEGLTTIGDYAFYYCSVLENIALPSTLTSLGTYVFYNCRDLRSIVIPDGVTSIGTYAFYGCNLLDHIVIGGGVTTIGSNAFNGCSVLTAVYYNGTEEEWDAISITSTNNSALTGAARYYYSDTEPALNEDGTDYDGNFWHWVNGTIVVWKKS